MLENKTSENYGWFVRIFECYSFTSILDYRKMSKFYFSAFCSFRIWFWIEQHDTFRTKIDKIAFVFEESCCLRVFSPGDLKFILDAFSLKNLLHHIRKWRAKKIIYLFIFWLKMDCPFKQSITKHGYRIGFIKITEIIFWFEYGQNIFDILRLFFFFEYLL